MQMTNLSLKAVLCFIASSVARFPMLGASLVSPVRRQLLPTGVVRKFLAVYSHKHQQGNQSTAWVFFILNTAIKYMPCKSIFTTMQFCSGLHLYAYRFQQILMTSYVRLKKRKRNVRITLKLISSTSEVQNNYFLMTAYWFIKSDFHLKHSPVSLRVVGKKENGGDTF